MTSKQRYTYLFVAIVTLVAGCAVYMTITHHSDDYDNAVIFRLKELRSGTIAEWRDILSKAQVKKPEQLGTIDFSLPGSPGYGDDPSTEFFNPLGPYKANMFSLEDGEQSPLFNIRTVRLTSKTGEAPTVITALYSIIPVQRRCIVVDVELAPDTHEVITDNQLWDGCLSTSSGQSFYFIAVAVYQTSKDRP